MVQNREVILHFVFFFFGISMDNFVLLPTVQSSIADLLESINIPQRVLLSIFGFLAVINASSLRLCLDAALKQISQPISCANIYQKPRNKKPFSARWTEITKKYEHEFNRTGLPTLPKFRGFQKQQTDAFLQPLKERIQRRTVRNAASEIDRFNWSSSVQTSITAAFYVGYIFSQIPGGLLAQKYGGKFVLALSLMMAAILTLFTPLAIQHGGLFALIILRFLIGLCEGPAFPALSALLARWIPPNERGKLGSFALSGNQIGIVFVNIGSTIVLHLFRWPVIFYFFGGCALIWSFCFILFCSNEPSCDPFIRRKEYLYLQESISSIEPTADITPIPWKKIFINAPVWAMISSAIEYNWTEARIIAKVSPVLQIIEDQSLSADLRANLSASTPYLFNWVMSIVAGTVCDILVEHGIVSTTDVRRIMASINAFGSRLFIDLNSCFSCDQHDGLIARMNCIIGAMGSFYAGSRITPLDLSPNFAGILMAISNSVGSIAAIVLPQLEKLFPNSSLHRNLRSILCLLSATLTSGDVQTFDNAASMSEFETINNVQNF